MQKQIFKISTSSSGVTKDASHSKNGGNQFSEKSGCNEKTDIFEVKMIKKGHHMHFYAMQKF